MPELTITIKGQNLSQESFNRLKRDLTEASQAVDKLSDAQRTLNNNFLQIVTSIGVVTAGLGFFVRDSMRSAIALETMKRALAAVEGGADKANKALVSLREVAKLPGLNLQQAIQGYTNLRAIGMESELARRALMAFGNALVTVGKGASAMQLVILALTQMSAKGKVLGQDLRQIQEQLPQIRDAMKKAFGTADVEELQKVMERTGKTADDFIRVIVEQFEKLPKMTSGAQNAMENFQDAMMQLKASIGENLVPAITKFLNISADLMENFNRMPKGVRNVVTEILILGAGIGALTTAGLGLYKLMQVSLIPMLVALKVKIASLSALLASNPYTVWILALGALISVFMQVKKHMDRHTMDVDNLRKVWNDVVVIQKNETILKLSKEYEELSNKTGLTVEESNRLVSVQNELAKLSPNLIEGFDKQGNAILKSGEKIRDYVKLVRESTDEMRKNYLAIAEHNINRLKREQESLTKTRNMLQNTMKYLGETWRVRGADEIAVGKKLEPYVKKLTETSEKLAGVNRELEEFEKLRREIGGETMVDVKTPAPFPEYSKEAQRLYQRIERERLSIIEDEFERRKALAKFDLESARKKFEIETAGIEKTSAKYQELYAELLLAEQEYNNTMLVLERERNEKTRRERTKALHSIKMYELELERLPEREKARRRILLEYEQELEMLDKGDVAYKEKVLALQKKRDANLAKIEREETDVLRILQREIARERIEALTLPEYIRDEMIAKMSLEWAREDFERADKNDKEAIAKWEKAQLEYTNAIRVINRKRAEELRRASQEYERALMEFEGVSRLEQLRKEREWLLNEIERAKVSASPEEIMRMQAQLLRIDSEIKEIYRTHTDLIKEAERTLAEEMLRMTETNEQRLKILQMELNLRRELVEIERMEREGLPAELIGLRMQTAVLRYLRDVRNINKEIDEWHAKIQGLLEESEDFEDYFRMLEREFPLEVIYERLREKKGTIERSGDIIPDLLMSRQEFERIEGEVNRMYRTAWERKRDFLHDYVSDFVRIPYDILTVAWDVVVLERKYEDDIRRIQEKRLKSIDEIRRNEAMSVAQKAREIERIERESAERRRELEQELANRKKEIWLDYAKGFLANIFRRIVENIEERIASRITEYMLSQMKVSKSIPLGERESPSSFWKFLLSLTQIGIGVTTGNPALVTSGVTTAGMYAVEVPKPMFDNAYNDYIAYQLGQRKASYILGAKSVSDMLQNYTEGLMEKTKESNVVIPERIVLEVDGKELYGIIKRRDDKTISYKFAY